LATSLLEAVVGATVGPGVGDGGAEGVAPDALAGWLAAGGAEAAGRFLVEVPSLLAASVSAGAGVALECLFFFVLLATAGEAIVPDAGAGVGVEMAFPAAPEPDAGAF
jgi:hypothetical protein